MLTNKALNRVKYFKRCLADVESAIQANDAERGTGVGSLYWQLAGQLATKRERLLGYINAIETGKVWDSERVE